MTGFMLFLLVPLGFFGGISILAGNIIPALIGGTLCLITSIIIIVKVDPNGPDRDAGGVILVYMFINCVLLLLGPGLYHLAVWLGG